KQDLITALTTAPILKAPDYRIPFEVSVDASNEAIGAVLEQAGRPVAFLSKKFSGAELNWPTYEKETYALVYAISKWECYLQGDIPFIIKTDNAALTAISTQAKLTPKQSRWVQYLDGFKYNSFLFTFIFHCGWVVPVYHETLDYGALP